MTVTRDELVEWISVLLGCDARNQCTNPPSPLFTKGGWEAVRQPQIPLPIIPSRKGRGDELSDRLMGNFRGFSEMKIHLVWLY